MGRGTRSRLVWMAAGAIGVVVFACAPPRQLRRTAGECRRSARDEPSVRERDAASAVAGVLPRARVKAVLAS